MGIAGDGWQHVSDFERVEGRGIARRRARRTSTSLTARLNRIEIDILLSVINYATLRWLTPLKQQSLQEPGETDR